MALWGFGAKVFVGPVCLCVFVYLQFAEHHNLTQCTVSSFPPILLRVKSFTYFFDDRSLPINIFQNENKFCKNRTMSYKVSAVGFAHGRSHFGKVDCVIWRIVVI